MSGDVYDSESHKNKYKKSREIRRKVIFACLTLSEEASVIHVTRACHVTLKMFRAS